MGMTFKLLETNPKIFFDILPQDWQDEIVPFWNQYEDSSRIYVLKEDGQIIGGGIVFSTCPPDVLYYKKEAQNWFQNGYLYVGFIWIAENRRNKNLGSFWLDGLKKIYPEQKFWLLTEEEHLHRFYQKNEFVLIETILNNGITEWLYTFKPPLSYKSII
jgi:hypothetical protein